MGKFSRSWQLVKQSFAILRSDKQLMLFPVLSTVSCFIVTAIIATGGAFLLCPPAPRPWPPANNSIQTSRRCSCRDVLFVRCELFCDRVLQRRSRRRRQ